jgi:hypothetical protein
MIQADQRSLAQLLTARADKTGSRCRLRGTQICLTPGFITGPRRELTGPFKIAVSITGDNVGPVIMAATVKIALAAGGRHASIEATADGLNTAPRSLR